MKRNKAGVSSVIANILLIVLVVVTVGVVMAFVAGLGRPVTPVTTWVTIEGAYAGSNQIKLFHMSGDTLSDVVSNTSGNMEVRVNGSTTGVSWSHAGNFGAGDMITVNLGNLLEPGDVITVIYKPTKQEILRKEVSGAGPVSPPSDQWKLIESWTGTVSAPALVPAWQLIETWTGTVSAPAGWKLIETWTGTVLAPQPFNPSGYSLVDNTRYISGEGNLVSNDSAYMTFRSYVSETSPTARTNAFISYRDSTTTLNTPKERTWTGDTATWSLQSELPTAGNPVRFARVAYSPIEKRSLEKIVVTLSNDGFLDAYVWDGTSWAVTNNVGSTGTTANAYQCFDIAYEKTSGRALLVYSRGTTTNEIGYRIWAFGSGWGPELLLDLPRTTGIIRWISLATAPGTRSGTADDNEIALIYLDANTDVHGYVWAGSSWSEMGATAVWDATAAISTEQCIAVAYEQTSGRAMFIWGDGTTDINNYRIWDGSTLTGVTTLTITAQGAVSNWITLKANPTSIELMYLVVDGARDLNTAYWSGSAWTIHTEHDANVDTHAQRCADFAWEPTGSRGLLVWGTTAAARISYKTFTASGTWGTVTGPSMGSNTHSWVQLRGNPRAVSGDVRILGAVLDSNFDIGAIKWDGTTFTVIGSNTISSDTTVVTRESFELEFMLFGPPTEFTENVEFTGTSNTNPWGNLTWTVDSQWTTSGVNVTLQLYNYQLGRYAQSGEDGYINYTSGAANIDETKSQIITTNPTRFRDASGNWGIKVSGVKATGTQFDLKADWVEFKPS